LVRRTTIGIGNLSPPRVQTNVQVPCVNMGRGQLYFLPDTILYRDDNGYGAIAYIDFRLAQGFTRFIESDGVPADATVVDHTWRYVNKNGGPDRRFNNNRQLPVLQLGDPMNHGCTPSHLHDPPTCPLTKQRWREKYSAGLAPEFQTLAESGRDYCRRAPPGESAPAGVTQWTMGTYPSRVTAGDRQREA